MIKTTTTQRNKVVVAERIQFEETAGVILRLCTDTFHGLKPQSPLVRLRSGRPSSTSSQPVSLQTLIL